MELNYNQETNGMYKLHKSDFDDIALMLLREYLASVIDSPCEVDINYLIKECLYLDIYSKYLSANKSILGLVAFEDTTITYHYRVNSNSGGEDLHLLMSFHIGFYIVAITRPQIRCLHLKRWAIYHALNPASQAKREF